MGNRPRAEIEALDDAILAVLEEDHPQSVRHTFYRLVDVTLPVHVDKTDAGYATIARRCALLREKGRMPWGWIVDMSRSAFRYDGYNGLGDTSFIGQTAALYRRNYWQELDVYCEVWAESRSIASVLQTECSRAGVDLYPAGGFASSTFIHEAAGEIAGQGKPKTVILYVGDYDPAGLHIDRDIESKMRRYLTDLGYSGSVEFDRLAINKAQIEQYRLPTKPRKKTDLRRLDVEETVEAEAMPAATLRGIVRARIEQYLPAEQLETWKEVERQESDTLIKRLVALAYPA